MKKKLLILLILFSIIPLFDLLKPGLPITHDGQDHVARIANFYQNLSDGNIIPRWAPNLNWGYGHPILMFLYPLPSYFASLFHFLGFSLVDSVKIIFGLTFSLSGIFMFLWLSEFLGDYPAFVGGMLYMFAPYRFVDFYVRGALGEHVAFVFLPLILYFLLKVCKEKKYKLSLLIGGSLSVTGLFLSHNAISIMFLPIAFLYSVFLTLTSQNKRKLTYMYIGILAFGVGLSSFFLFPAFFEGKYTLRDIVTAKDYATRFMDFGKFLYGQWNYGISGQFDVEAGILQWIFILLAFPLSFFLYKEKSKLYILSIASIVIFFATILLMTPSSKIIWDKITILQKFQFPWRFLSITVFISSVAGSLFIYQVSKKYQIISVILVTLAIVFLNNNFWHAKGYLLKNESFFTGIYNSTTDTGESSPIWSVRFMEKRPKGHIQVIKGSAKIKELFRNSTKHDYYVESFGVSRIRENTSYFPGWQVLVDDQKTSIEFQDPQNRGVITFFVPSGKHKISLEFGETRLRLISDIISVASIVYLLILLLWQNKQFRLS